MTIRQDAHFEEAEIRNTERKKRTPKQQLDLLNKRLGTEIGAKKERAKLKQQIER